jgi:hypothetical protein
MFAFPDVKDPKGFRIFVNTRFVLAPILAQFMTSQVGEAGI